MADIEIKETKVTDPSRLPEAEKLAYDERQEEKQKRGNVQFDRMVTLEEKRKGIADDLVAETKARQRAVNIERDIEDLKESQAERFKIGEKTFSKQEAIEQKKQNLDKAKQTREKLQEFIGAQKANQSSSNNVRKKNNLTDAGQRFKNEAEELQSLPSFPSIDSPTERSLAGEFVKDSIIGQTVEAGKEFAETRISNPTKAFNDLTPGIQLPESSVDFVDSPVKGDPRQQFVDQLPELSTTQTRFAGFVDEEIDQRFTEKEQRQLSSEFSESFTKSIPQADLAVETVGLVDENAEKRARNTFTDLVDETAKGVPEELIEKTTELPAITGAFAQAEQKPAKTAQEIGSGALELSGKVRKDPVEFTGQEIFSDIGLDLATGGGVAISFPAANKITGAATNTKVKAQKGFSEFQKLREGGKRQSTNDVFTELALDKSPIRNTGAVDTISETGIGPQSFDLVEPKEFNTIDIEFSKPNTAKDVGTRINDISTAFSEASTTSSNKSISDSLSSPFTESISEPLVETQPASNTIPEVVAIPQARSSSLAESFTLSEPVAKPNVRQQTQPFLSLDIEDSSSSEDVESVFGSGSREFELIESVGAELLGIKGNTTKEEAKNPFSLRPLS